MFNNSPKFVSLRPENSSFLNVRNRCFLKQRNSLRQCEEICETVLAKNPQKCADSLQVTGASQINNFGDAPPFAKAS
jgi:hypothetical protein